MPKAGKVKCKRCKLIFIRAKGNKSKTCASCLDRCFRCNAHSKPRYCLPCTKEIKTYSDIEKRKDYQLIATYHITLHEYRRILDKQNGVCFICKKPPVNNLLSVDHKHQYKESQVSAMEKRAMVRGLICWQCNNAIAKFKDNLESLRNAVIYLETWPAQEILKEKNAS